MKKLSFYLLMISITLGFHSCQPPASGGSSPDEKYAIVPLPASMTPQKGEFSIGESTVISVADEAMDALPTADMLSGLIQGQTSMALAVEKGGSAGDGKIHFGLNDGLESDEAYTLDVSSSQINISAKGAAGFFYAIQSLRQLFPPAFEAGGISSLSVPAVKIEDEPRYVYRGMMLDVGRHFFPVEFVKKYIDLLAIHKMNRFHWHLTEDQGWRVEIKKYPKLMEVAAFRDETLIGHYSDQPWKFTGERYGGYYTQEEMREVVAYAAERHITVVPEIEMPGHSAAVLAAYPELGCKDGPYEVKKVWGIHEDIYCPKEETFAFLENVLLEVMDIFPSKYIHIGGDEAPKVQWEESAVAQEVIKREGLKDEHELQSYFIQRMEKFLNSHGRSIIGWDEILEGGLAPNATVMSWRGMEGGIEAAKQGHDVIMTPTSHVYFDYYQADPEDEPLAIGGNLPIEKVYSLEPTPAELSPEEAKHILGTQGNLWTEYIPTGEKAEYMVFPRASALAEVAWSPKEKRDFDGFSKRIGPHLERLSNMGVNTAKHFFNVKASSSPGESAQALDVQLKTMSDKTTIQYTTDGSDPVENGTAYTGPISLTENATIQAVALLNGEPAGKTKAFPYVVSKATGIVPNLITKPDEKYFAGPSVLTDGVRGSMYFNDLWYGYLGEDAEIVIDLGENTQIKEIATNFLQTTYAWIFQPQEVSFHLSQDGEEFEQVTLASDPVLREDEENMVSIYKVETSLEDPKEARYVKVLAKNAPVPDWHGGAGKAAWLFIDEVEVR
ncbi:MAG: glycoside hydrolase family 20 protein [Bacteroidota bacterium]